MSTSEVADKVVEFHLAVGFDVLVVEVGVEHDDGKRQQEHSVSTTELANHFRVALRVAAGKCLCMQTQA